MAVYLSCLYSDPDHARQFCQEWEATGKKLNMGKSCIRFKKLEDVPLSVLGRAIKRVPVKRYIEHYEDVVRPSGGERRARATAKKKVAKKASVKKSSAKKKAVKKKAVKKKAGPGKASQQKSAKVKKAAGRPSAKPKGAATKATPGTSVTKKKAAANKRGVAKKATRRKARKGTR